MLNMVRCNYHLDKPVERYTLRELRGMVNDLAYVHPMIGGSEETPADPPKKKRQSSGTSSDDGTLKIPL